MAMEWKSPVGILTVVLAAMTLIFTAGTLEMYSAGDRIDALYSDMSDVKADVSAVKVRVDTIKEDLTEVKADLGEVLTLARKIEKRMASVEPEGGKSLLFAQSSSVAIKSKEDWNIAKRTLDKMGEFTPVTLWMKDFDSARELQDALMKAKEGAQ